MANKDNLTPSRAKSKPYPGFPLTAHPNGQWCKKIRGRLRYFGRVVDGWQPALATYQSQIEDILAGRVPGTKARLTATGGIRLLDLCNRWINAKRDLVNSGELKLRTWSDYHGTCTRLLGVLGDDRLIEGLGPDDFEKLRADFARTWGPVRTGNEITRTRMIFSYAFESGLIDVPIRFGPQFKKPRKVTVRRARKSRGSRMFEAAELRKIINAATLPLKAMILLAANGGLGNHDVGALPMDAVDLKKGWLDFPRPKTEVDREIPLWPETVKAIKDWLAIRPAAKHPEDERFVFLTKQRRAYFRTGRVVEDESGAATAKGFCSPVTTAFKWLLKNLGMKDQRGFYALRHGFETIAGDTGDQVAVNHIMGHADQSMAGEYRERIEPERLKKVTGHVRRWLFNK